MASRVVTQLPSRRPTVAPSYGEPLARRVGGGAGAPLPPRLKRVKNELRLNTS